MPILTIILVIVVVGICLWAINKYIPMEPSIKNILNIVVVVTLIVWILKVIGLFDYLTKVTI